MFVNWEISCLPSHTHFVTYDPGLAHVPQGVTGITWSDVNLAGFFSLDLNAVLIECSYNYYLRHGLSGLSHSLDVYYLALEEQHLPVEPTWRPSRQVWQTLITQNLGLRHLEWLTYIWINNFQDGPLLMEWINCDVYGMLLKKHWIMKCVWYIIQMLTKNRKCFQLHRLKLH